MFFFYYYYNYLLEIINFDSLCAGIHIIFFVVVVEGLYASSFCFYLDFFQKKKIQVIDLVAGRALAR
jgi:hypothetical protein